MRTAEDYDEAYARPGGPPWVIGGPQPALAAALDGLPAGTRVLDAGCGPGALAVHLARRGCVVTGFDLSPVAVSQAVEAAAGLPVEVRVYDATRVASFGGEYDVAADSGLLHSLADADRPGYVAGLASLLAPGGTAYVLALAPESGADVGMPADRLRELFAAWSPLDMAEIEVRADWNGEELRMPGHLVTAGRPA